ncbi:MAG TPA: hypothetical protein VFD58_00820 [Blastocatellia bacterium]|nr:hypothetical protein [Blastocatellia bacterium]
MNRPRLIAFSISILLLVASPASSQQKNKGRGPSTPEERRRAVEMTVLLENDPLSPEAEKRRKSLWYWLASVPDIKVSLCASLIGDIDQNGTEFGPELVVQMAFAQARFIIESPAEAGDEFRVYLAGVEGALRTYASVRRAKPTFRIYVLEALLEKQRNGALRQYVKSAMETCRKAAENPAEKSPGN